MVHAAAGGVGLLLTQIVKRRGGRRDRDHLDAEKAELAPRPGADHVAGYDDFGAVVADVTGGAGAAVVYDAVGESTFDDSLAAVRPRGYLVLYGAASGPVPPLELTRLSGPRSLYVTRPSLAAYVATREELLQRADDLFGWIVEHRLDVTVGAEYPLQEARRAHEDLAARRPPGSSCCCLGDRGRADRGRADRGRADRRRGPGRGRIDTVDIAGTDAATWPALPLAEWQPTRDTLHLWTQIVGKVRLALAPAENHWWKSPLYVNAVGLTTSLMPYRGLGVEIVFDFTAMCSTSVPPPGRSGAYRWHRAAWPTSTPMSGPSSTSSTSTCRSTRCRSSCRT